MPVVTTKERKLRKRIDSRRWTDYNNWQAEEVLLAMLHLRALVESSTIHDWERGDGRPRVPRRVIVLCLLVKAYLDVSYRRLHGHLLILQPILGLEDVPHYNTVAKYGRDSGLTPTLSRLFDETAQPFWLTEKTISIDSTGLLLHGSGAWRLNKSDDSPRDFAKLHVLSGTKSRATLAIRTTRGAWHDNTQFEPLVKKKPANAVARAITGDSAYWSRRSATIAKENGLQPYLNPKDNARHWAKPKDAFEKQTRFARQFPNRFKKKYSERNTSESRNATEKLLFGERLRSRRPAGRRNETFARETVYNVRLLTQGDPRN